MQFKRIEIWIEEDALERLRSTQNELNKQGASDLVVELFMSKSPINILEESVNLAIALLEGGNTDVQVCIRTFASSEIRLILTCKWSNRPVYILD